MIWGSFQETPLHREKRQPGTMMVWRFRMEAPGHLDENVAKSHPSLDLLTVRIWEVIRAVSKTIGMVGI